MDKKNIEVKGAGFSYFNMKNLCSLIKPHDDVKPDTLYQGLTQFFKGAQHKGDIKTLSSLELAVDAAHKKFKAELKEMKLALKKSKKAA